MQNTSDFEECYRRTTKTAPAGVYLSAFEGLFPGKRFSAPVDMQGTLAARYGGDVVLLGLPEERKGLDNQAGSFGNPGQNAESFFVDNKIRAKEHGEDVFFEAFHVFFRQSSNVPFTDRTAQQLLGKKVFFLLAEAFNRIPLAHRNLPEVFSAVNSVLTAHAEPFRVKPGWGLSSKLVSDVVLSTYPSGASQAYRKDQVQKAVVSSLSEGLRDRRLRTLSPSLTKSRDGGAPFMTFNTAIEIDWLAEKNTKVLSLPSTTDRSDVVRYAGLSVADKDRLDTIVMLKLKNKGVLRLQPSASRTSLLEPPARNRDQFSLTHE